MIKQRGNSWQVNLQVKGTRFRKSVPTQTEAVELEEYARSQLEQGLPVHTGPLKKEVATLGELQQKVYDRFWRGTRNSRTAKINSLAVVDFFGSDRDLVEITAMEIDKLVEHLREKGNSVATVNRKLSALSKMLNYAEDRDLIDKAPKIDYGKESQGRLRWYTVEEEDRILDHLDDEGKHDFRELVTYLLDTGCRASEAGRLRWQDITDDTVHIWVSKSKKHRSIPLPERARKMLEERAERTNARPGELVFPGWLTISHEGDESVWKMTSEWGDLRDALGFTDSEANLHACRHTYASRLVQAGVPLRAVQALMGHASIMTTQRYAHLAPSNLVDAVATLNRG